MKHNKLATELGALLQQHQLCCAVAESCTGGGLAFAITEIPGSSAWFDRGFVTYTNESKEQLLGVSSEIISAHGAVSAETVCAMVSGVLNHTKTDLAVAISGIAGPTGGSTEKPVGTVWIAWSRRGKEPEANCFLFQGDRQAVRDQAIEEALRGMIRQII